MNDLVKIQALLEDKADCQARLNLLPYDGSPEIKEQNGSRYLYVRKRIAGKLTSTYVDAYSDELYQLLLKNAKDARVLRKRIRLIERELTSLGYKDSELSSRVLQNIDFARANMKSNIYDQAVDVDVVRKNVGMVFQRPNPFPKSIFENVAYGLRVNGIKDKDFITERVETALKGAALWNEVKDKLKESAYALSGGQQQRLCIARAMAVSPSVLLMDEPASALDPISTAKIEELICELSEQTTIVIVTHSMQQAARVSHKTAFFYLGEMVEYDETKKIFTHPEKEATQNYITGRFG